MLDARLPEDMARAADLIRAGGLVAVPTETVYGLAADARQPEAVAGIFEAKGRPVSHPLIVHIGDASALTDWARDVPRHARMLAEAFWPGPLTLLLRKNERVPDVVTAGLPTVGLRVPAHPVLLDLLRRVNTGLAAPSANRYRELSPTRAEHVLERLRGRIDAVLDGGPCAFGLESTIVDLSGERPRLARPGPVTAAAIEAVIGVAPGSPDAGQRTPGSDPIHYRPRTPAFLVAERQLSDALKHADRHGLRVALLLPEGHGGGHSQVVVIRLPGDKAGYARGLYHALHRLDRSDADLVLVQAPPDLPGWEDVHDRLRRACLPWGESAVSAALGSR